MLIWQCGKQDLWLKLTDRVYAFTTVQTTSCLVCTCPCSTLIYANKSLSLNSILPFFKHKDSTNQPQQALNPKNLICPCRSIRWRRERPRGAPVACISMVALEKCRIWGEGVYVDDSSPYWWKGQTGHTPPPWECNLGSTRPIHRVVRERTMIQSQQPNKSHSKYIIRAQLGMRQSYNIIWTWKDYLTQGSVWSGKERYLFYHINR